MARPLTVTGMSVTVFGVTTKHILILVTVDSDSGEAVAKQMKETGEQALENALVNWTGLKVIEWDYAIYDYRPVVENRQATN